MSLPEDWLKLDGVIMVRECSRIMGFDMEGKEKGLCGAVSFRPATKEELVEIRGSLDAKRETDSVG